MRTKFEIMKAREAALKEALEAIQHRLEAEENTPCGLSCDCGQYFETEADFAKHFIIPDEHFLNLGECPVKGARPHFPVRTLTEEIVWRVQVR